MPNHTNLNPGSERVQEKSKVNILHSGGGFIIEITDTPIDQMYAVTRDELEQIVLLGGVVLREKK